MAGPFGQRRGMDPERPPTPPVTDRGGPRDGEPFDAPVHVTTSHAAHHFVVASLGSALLAITSAALFYHSAGSAGALVLAAVGCLTAAALLQVCARRWMREELVAEGIRQGLDERTARKRARAAVSHWLRRPHV